MCTLVGRGGEWDWMVPRQPIYAGADETRENAESGSWVREPHPPRRARRGSRSRRVPSTASLRESRLTSTFARRRAHASHRRVMRAATVKAHAHEHRKPDDWFDVRERRHTEVSLFIRFSTGCRRRDEIWRVESKRVCVLRVLHVLHRALRSTFYVLSAMCLFVCATSCAPAETPTFGSLTCPGTPCRRRR